MQDGTIELVDLKSNSTKTLVKLSDIKDASIFESLWRLIVLTSGAGQGRCPLDRGLEDFFGHETLTLENRPPQAMETLGFLKLLDPRYRGEEHVADDPTVSTTHHSLCRMVTNRPVDRVRRQKRRICNPFRRNRF